MTKTGLNSAAPSFNSPLEMLRACHGRITEQCSTLNKLLHHLPAHGNDIQAQQAALAILRYFDTAGKFHHQDEEQDLFPLLRAAGNQKAEALIERLLLEHGEMDAAWQALRSCLQEIADVHTARLDKNIIEHFNAAYARHIKLENEELLPLAASLLSSEQLRELGQKMAARRGVTFTAA